jgi:threonine/homoserine/homoserine lactone efflux protein
MIDFTTLLLFSAASFLLAITPGPDMLYIAIGLLGGSVSGFFKRRRCAGSVGKWVTGTVFIGLGIGTALTNRGKS